MTIRRWTPSINVPRAMEENSFGHWVEVTDLWRVERQRDELRVKAGEARVLLEDGRPGKAHAVLEQIRDEEEIEAAETQDREDEPRKEIDA